MPTMGTATEQGREPLASWWTRPAPAGWTADALDAAEREEAEAQARLLADPTDEHAVALVAAREALEAAPGPPDGPPRGPLCPAAHDGPGVGPTRHRGRARLIRDAMVGPVRVRRGDPNRGRSGPDFSARLVTLWRGGRQLRRSAPRRLPLLRYRLGTASG